VEETDPQIERTETGIRILLSLLYLVIARVLETVLFVVILFELLYALITKDPPGEGVRRFANRTVSYFYRIGRFLTYNDHRAPFPFAELPDEVEPTGSGHRASSWETASDEDD
jgi:hypothetical protein